MVFSFVTVLCSFTGRVRFRRSKLRWRKVSISSLSAYRHRLLLLSKIPASNKDPEATKDGGADKHFLANAANRTYVALLVGFQYSNEFLNSLTFGLSIKGSCMYSLIITDILSLKFTVGNKTGGFVSFK